MSLNLEAQIEAVLFVSGEPVSLKQLQVATGVDNTAIKNALESLRKSLSGRGIRLIVSDGRYSLATVPEASQAVERFIGTTVKADLSKPALETLAIIAYKQPVTRAEIEEIRGVASDQTLRNLLMRGLIIEAGQADTPGRPTLYVTSIKFLHHFGLSSADELRPIGQEPGQKE
jgi:segregation and condensation protein B